MVSDGSHPLLFLDVDGPLIPFGLPPGYYAAYPGPRDDGSNPALARISPGHGPRLAALPYTLVWATTWGKDVNELIAPRARASVPGSHDLAGGFGCRGRA